MILDKLSALGKPKAVPSRLAINLRTLLAVLEKITKKEILESNNVIVHLFKYLVVYKEKI